MSLGIGEIDGVRVVPKRIISDERGAVMHMLRSDDPEFQAFGEIYFSKVLPGVVKGWHLHQKMTLNYRLVTGSVQLVLFDDRKKSPSFGRYQQILLDELDGKLVLIPPFVWNAFIGLGSKPSILANCATHPHDPQEILRRPFNDSYFDFDWNLQKPHCTHEENAKIQSNQLTL